MATTLAVGSGPFEFTDANGHQISIPLTAFTFNPDGSVNVDPAWQPLTNVPPGSTLLSYALKQKLIRPRPVSSPIPAMLIRAADPGSGGNNITVSVVLTPVVTSPPSNDPTIVPFNLTVTEIDTYSGLTTATIESTLGSGSGSSAVVGTAPGLVQIVHGSVDISAVPHNLSPTFLSGSPAELDVTASGSPPLAFTLVAKKTGADGLLTKVSVAADTASPPNPGPPTFTLVAQWTKTVNGITLPQLDTMAQALAYEIIVSKPGTGAYSLPANTTMQLSGGGPGVKATGSLFTS
jgi:hypothetical protein